MNSKIFIILNLTLIFIVINENTYRLKGRKFPCLSYSREDKSIGCSSKFSGSHGLLWILDTSNIIDEFIGKELTENYIVGIYSDLFDEKILKLSEKNNVNGILVLYRGNHVPTYQSFEDKKLNNYNDYYKDVSVYLDHQWNPNGADLMLKLYKIPMIYIHDEKDIEKLTKCFSDRNLKDLYPKCGITINSFMNSYSINTAECIRKNDHQVFTESPGFCSNLKAKNIYAEISPPTSSKDFIIISTKLDTRFLFYEGNLGFQSELASIIVFLSLIKLINQNKNTIFTANTPPNLLFIGFDGESWDNIGSSNFAFRVVAEKKLFRTIKEENIKKWIEIGSFGDSKDNYYIHTDPKITDTNVKTETDSMITKIKDTFTKKSLTISRVSENNVNKPLPPSSLKEIYRHDIKIPGIYISNFENVFNNKYFNGIYDDAKNLGINHKTNLKDYPTIKRLAKLTIALMESIKDILGSTSVSPIVDTTVEAEVAKLAECLMFTFNCELFKDLHDPEFVKSFLKDEFYSREIVPDNYVSPYIETLSRYIGMELGKKLQKSDSECKYTNPTLFNFKTTTHCILNASVWVKSEHSRYFHDPQLYANYSSWTMSNFDEPFVEIWYIQSTKEIIKGYVFGIILSIICLLITLHFLKKDKINLIL